MQDLISDRFCPVVLKQTICCDSASGVNESIISPIFREIHVSWDLEVLSFVNTAQY